MNEIPDPVTLLRAHHRAALDRQAELATEARALAVEVQEVTDQLATISRRVNAYRLILQAIATAQAPPKQEVTE